MPIAGDLFVAQLSQCSSRTATGRFGTSSWVRACQSFQRHCPIDRDCGPRPDNGCRRLSGSHRAQLLSQTVSPVWRRGHGQAANHDQRWWSGGLASDGRQGQYPVRTSRWCGCPARACAGIGLRAIDWPGYGRHSTDTARTAPDQTLQYESTKAGVRILTPTLPIETVASGGGSICWFDGVSLRVGHKALVPCRVQLVTAVAVHLRSLI